MGSVAALEVVMAAAAKEAARAVVLGAETVAAERAAERAAVVTAAALAVAREVEKEVAAQAVPEAEAAAGSERLRMRLVAAARHPFRNTSKGG